MLTFSKLGKKGNLGNQLFQIAATVGLAKTGDFGFPQWDYQQFFKHPLPSVDRNISFTQVKEIDYHYTPYHFESDHVDLEGWFQSEKYFDRVLTKYYFEFADSLEASLRKTYNSAFERRTILISIRRGDFVDHPDYFQLPFHYYINALLEFFPDWESYNLIVLGDDIDYCKYHFSFLPNAYFADGLNAVEQLCLGTLCDDFIISNSTFSWWTAWLGEKEHSTVVRPLKNFDGRKSIVCDDKDYYPDRWTLYNHIGVKIDLTGVTFLLPNKTKSTLRLYHESYYKNAEFENNTAEKIRFSYTNNYFLPPLLIYCAVSKISANAADLIRVEIHNIMTLSVFFDISRFHDQKDVGFFSKVMRPVKGKKRIAIYVKGGKIGLSGEVLQLKASAGIFVYFGGLRYTTTVLIKKAKFEIRQMLNKYTASSNGS